MMKFEKALYVQVKCVYFLMNSYNCKYNGFVYRITVNTLFKKKSVKSHVQAFIFE